MNNYTVENYEITTGSRLFEIKNGNKTVTAWGKKAQKASLEVSTLLGLGDDIQTKIWLCSKLSNGF
jgi:hypothetical protein